MKEGTKMELIVHQTNVPLQWLKEQCFSSTVSKTDDKNYHVLSNNGTTYTNLNLIVSCSNENVTSTICVGSIYEHITLSIYISLLSEFVFGTYMSISLFVTIKICLMVTYMSIFFQPTQIERWVPYMHLSIYVTYTNLLRTVDHIYFRMLLSAMRIEKHSATHSVALPEIDTFI